MIRVRPRPLSGSMMFKGQNMNNKGAEKNQNQWNNSSDLPSPERR